MGEGVFARVEHLMVLEEGEMGGRVCFVVLKCLKLPTLTSSLLSMVLERLEVNGSSPFRETVFLLPWWLAWGYIAVCAGLCCCLCNGVPKGHLFGSLPLSARGMGVLHGLWMLWLLSWGPEKIQYLAYPM